MSEKNHPSHNPPPKPDGEFVKLLNQIKNSRPVQSGLTAFNYVQKTAPYKILTVRAVGTAVGITFGAMALAGIGTVAFPVAIIGIVATGIGIIIDVTTVRGSRQLHQENRLLVKNRTAKNKQDLFLKLEPNLAKALENDLYYPAREGKRSVNQRYIKDAVIDSSILNYGKAMLKNSIGSVATIAKAIGGNPFSILKATVTTAIGMYTEGSATFTIAGKQLENQQNIDAERNKPDTPGYNNRLELKAATREQRIQTMALEKLITEKPNKEIYPPTGTFRHGTPKQIQNRFRTIKSEIAATEKAINTTRHPVVAFALSIGKDVVRTFNPFSKYTSPQNLVVPKHANLTKAVEKHESPEFSTYNKENAKGISTNDAKTLHGIKKEVATHVAQSKGGTAKHHPPMPETSDKSIGK